MEALKIGYLHNKQADQSKPMTFMDRVRIMRPLVAGVPAKSTELTARKDKIRLIFDLNTITELNNNFKTHMTIARAGSELYNLALEVEKQWDAGTIKGQPKKVEPIRQTRFSTFNNRKVPEEEKEEALRILLSDGLKKFEEIVEPWKPKKKAAASQAVPSDENTENDVHFEEAAVAEPVPSANEVEQLRKENQELQEENKTLKEENSILQRELEELKKKISEDGKVCYMSSLSMSETDKSKGKTKDGLSSKRKFDDSLGATSISSPLKAPRLNSLPQREDFQVGQNVMARYSGDGQEYRAKIIKKLKNGSFKVCYDADKIKEDLDEKDLRPV